jgi:hypothetical protein
MLPMVPFIGGLFARFLTGTGLRYLAYKALILFLAVTILPAVLMKVWFLIKLTGLYFVSTYVGDLIAGGLFESVTKLEITGVGAYLAEQLQLAQGVSILLSCSFAGWMLGFLRK